MDDNMAKCPKCGSERFTLEHFVDRSWVLCGNRDCSYKGQVSEFLLIIASLQEERDTARRLNRAAENAFKLQDAVSIPGRTGELNCLQIAKAWLALERRAETWERRAKAFQDGYRNSESENMALKIQKMQLEAEGADKVTAMQNEKLRVRHNAACIERNDAKEALRQAIAEIEEHNSEYHHITSKETIDKFKELANVID